MEIDKIAGPLRKVLREREIIARCELLLRTYDIVRAADLSEEDREELHEFWASQRGRVLEIMKNVHPLYEMLKIDPDQIWMDAKGMAQPPAPVLNSTEKSIQ